jgi:hypothetical protein
MVFKSVWYILLLIDAHEDPKRDEQHAQEEAFFRNDQTSGRADAVKSQGQRVVPHSPGAHVREHLLRWIGLDYHHRGPGYHRHIYDFVCAHLTICDHKQHGVFPVLAVQLPPLPPLSIPRSGEDDHHRSSTFHK